MFVSSSSSWPSHGFADCGFIHFLLVRPFMFVSRDVSRLVDDVFAARLPLPAARRVEALLVRTRELGGVRQSAHRRRGHSSLWWVFQKRRLEFTSRTMLRVEVSGESVWELTVTPAMMGDFPSISLKTSASASSALFSLYFFLASSVSATLNSSYVMLRQDFFLEAEVGKGAFNACTWTCEDRNAAACSSALVSLRPLAHWLWESGEMYTEPCATASAWKMEDGILLG